MLELFDREADAPADADRHELLAPDELIDRRSADREDGGRLWDIDQEWPVLVEGWVVFQRTSAHKTPGQRLAI